MNSAASSRTRTTNGHAVAGVMLFAPDLTLCKQVGGGAQQLPVVDHDDCAGGDGRLAKKSGQRYNSSSAPLTKTTSPSTLQRRKVASGQPRPSSPLQQQRRADSTWRNSTSVATEEVAAPSFATLTPPQVPRQGLDLQLPRLERSPVASRSSGLPLLLPVDVSSPRGPPCDRRFQSNGGGGGGSSLDVPALEQPQYRGLTLPAPDSPKPSHNSPTRNSPRRTLSVQMLDGPDGTLTRSSPRRTMSVQVVDYPIYRSTSSSSMSSSPRRTITTTTTTTVDVQKKAVVMDDQRKRLVRAGQSVRKIAEPETPQEIRTALARTGQSVRGLSFHEEEEEEEQEPMRNVDYDDDDSVSEVANNSITPLQEATTTTTTTTSNADAAPPVSDTSASSFPIAEEPVVAMTRKETTTTRPQPPPKEAKTAVAPLPRRMSHSMSISNIPYMEPLVEEDSDRNESEEFHLMSIAATSRKQPLLSHTPDDEEEGSIGVQIPSRQNSGSSAAVAKRPRSPLPAVAPTETEKAIYIAPPTSAESTTTTTTTTRNTKMGLISRVSNRFLRKSVVPQPRPPKTKGVGLRALSCRHAELQVVDGCYGPPPGLSHSITASTFATSAEVVPFKPIEVPSKLTEVPSKPTEICLSTPPPVRQATLNPAPISALKPPPPTTTRPLPTTLPSSLHRPLPSAVLTPPPKTSRPVPIIRSTSQDPNDLVFSPPIHTTTHTTTRSKSYQDTSCSSLRKSSDASDSISGSPTVSQQVKTISARSPSRPSPRRNMSRSHIRNSIRSIISQRSFATNNAVSEGIYPQKAGALGAGTSPCRRRNSAVARLSFRLSQSDLNYNAIRNVPDPSNLQEKQEERRNLLSRMARQRDADSRTAELSITHTRQDTFMDVDDDDEDENADDDASAQEDDYGYVPPMISFYADGPGNADGDEESAITDACTWADMSSASIGSRCGGGAGDIKVLPSEIQNADEDNVSCLYDGSGSFRLPKAPSSGQRFGNSITRQASAMSMLDSSIGLLGVDDAADPNLLPPGVDRVDDDDQQPPSVSLFHVSPTRRSSYPKMLSLRPKTVMTMDNSDGSLYHDDDDLGKPKAKTPQELTNAGTPYDEDDDEDGKPRANEVVTAGDYNDDHDAGGGVIPGDTMDENFYLAEIVKALEEQSRKTKLAHRKAKKSKPSTSYMLEL